MVPTLRPPLPTDDIKILDDNLTMERVWQKATSGDGIFGPDADSSELQAVDSDGEGEDGEEPSRVLAEALREETRREASRQDNSSEGIASEMAEVGMGGIRAFVLRQVREVVETCWDQVGG